MTEIHRNMTENYISGQVQDACIKIHRVLGPGLLESVYEEVLTYELRKRGFTVERQKSIKVCYDGLELEQGFKADLIVDNLVIIELKSVEDVLPVHHKQLLTYLKLTGIRLGLLINFNVALLTNGFKRIANNL